MYTLPQYFLSGSDGAGPPPFKTSNFFIEGDFESTTCIPQKSGFRLLVFSHLTFYFLVIFSGVMLFTVVVLMFYNGK